jgi:chemotaxis-related protein WspB
MLHLVFRAGPERYLLPVESVVEVLPLVEWTTLPDAPRGVVGVFSYHGTAVPLLDLGEVLFATPAPTHRGTRILLVRYPRPDRDPHLLGLVVEDATRLVRRREADFVPNPVGSAPACVGPLTTDDAELIPRVELRQLVPEELWERLLGPAQSAP